MMHRNNVIGRRPRPTKKSYREAVKKIVLRLQHDHGLNDPELAERLGCSAPTIANARLERTNLDGVTLANIEHEFGPSALDPFLELGGSRSVPLTALGNDGQNACILLLDAVKIIIETQDPGSDGGVETTGKEVAPNLAKFRDARRSLDALIALGEAAVAEAMAA